LDVPSTSSASDATSNVPTRQLLGDANEFEVAQRQWLERQARRRAAAAAAVVATPGSVVVAAASTTESVVVAATHQSVEHS
jgi:hypothetical protein